ncbi:MAG: hypothetical protein AAFX65_10665 [Cyanobacteria bacterium J06638_7]
MASFTLSDAGGAHLATLLKAQAVFHLAMGSGDPSWSVGAPAEDAAATALQAEFGRREALAVEYAQEDGGGIYSIDGRGSWSATPTPTRHLLIHFQCDLTNGVGQAVRELAIYMNTTRQGGVPAGQKFLRPADIDDPGIRLAVLHPDSAGYITLDGVNRYQLYYLHSF